MIKVLYLLVGICVKQTIDEVKTLTEHRIKHLEAVRSARGTFRPLPALQAGTPEAHMAIQRARHQREAQPEIQKLSRKISRLRFIPLLIYAGATLVLLLAIAYLESRGVTTK